MQHIKMHYIKIHEFNNEFNIIQIFILITNLYQLLIMLLFFNYPRIPRIPLIIKIFPMSVVFNILNAGKKILALFQYSTIIIILCVYPVFAIPPLSSMHTLASIVHRLLKHYLWNNWLQVVLSRAYSETKSEKATEWILKLLRGSCASFSKCLNYIKL